MIASRAASLGGSTLVDHELLVDPDPGVLLLLDPGVRKSSMRSFLTSFMFSSPDMLILGRLLPLGFSGESGGVNAGVIIYNISINLSNLV